MQRWGEKRYHSLDFDMKETYHQKVYKLNLDGGMTCPNRDGKISHGGCIFCSSHGSGDFAGSRSHSISKQIALGKEELSRKRPVRAYIAYFQAFTNTYAPVEQLRALFTEAIADEEVKILSIATRPDCLSKEVLELLEELNQQKPVWVELGLQTIHEHSATFIRRGYPLDVFTQAVTALRTRNIEVIVHTILFLPCETKEEMLQTIDFLNQMDIQGIKLQLLHVLSDTDLGTLYRETPFPIPTREEYIAFLGECIARLRPDITIHRLTGDGPKELLLAPLWTSEKRTVLNHFHQHLKEHNIWQGKDYHERIIHLV